MHRVTLVVASQPLIDLALTWSAHGLVGPSAWLEANEVRAAASTEDRQHWQVHVIDASGAAVDQCPLTRYLATWPDLDEVRIVWARPSSEASDTAAHSDLEEFVYSVLTGRQDRFLIDVVLPEGLGAVSAAPIIPRWTQYVLRSVDRPTPDRPDAGWTHRSEAAVLHGLLAVSGILAGSFPAPNKSADVSWDVEAYSRFIGGGRLTQDGVAAFLDDELPSVSAADADGEHFTFFEDESAAVARGLAEVRSAANGALDYQAPPPVRLKSPRRLSWGHVLRMLWCDFRFMLAQLFPRSEARASSSVSFWEADDLGYLAEQGSQATDGASWQDVDSQQRAILRERLNAAAVDDSHLPPSQVWRELTRVCCALVDGGGRGKPYMMEYVGHGMVVRPAWVDPGPYEAVPDEHVEAVRALRELRDIESGRIVGEALRLARSRLSNTPAALVAPPGRRVTATAQRLVGETNERIRELREAQRSSLPDIEVSEPVVSLADRLYADVVADRLRSRLDGDRWGEAALGEMSEGNDLPRATALIRTLVIVATLGTIAGSWIWTERGSEIQSWFDSTMGTTPPSWSGYAAAILFGLLLIGVATRIFHVAVRAVKERRERIQEIRVGLTERACAAYAQSRVLEHGARILGAWHAILKGLFPNTVAESEVRESQPVVDTPAAIALFKPNTDAHWLTRTHIAPRVARPGWRWEALHHVVETAAQADGVMADRGREQVAATVDDLFENDGMPGSALDRVRVEVASGRPWLRWRRRAIESVTREVQAALADGVRSVSLMGDTGLDREGTRRQTTVSGVLSEIKTSVDGRGWEWNAQTARPEDPDAKPLEPTIEWSAGAVRIVGDHRPKIREPGPPIAADSDR